MEIVTLDSENQSADWDEYVLSKTSVVTDLWAWRHVLREAYGISSCFLAAKSEQGVQGTLGLYEIRHPIFGHYLVTAPFGNDGGFHFDTLAAKSGLLQAARDLADRLNVSYLLIRTRDVDLTDCDFVVSRHNCTAIIDLQPGPDSIWRDRLRKKTRSAIRRSKKEPFTVSFGLHNQKAFFNVFHKHMRDLGSPAHSPKFYDAIARHFNQAAEFGVVNDGNQVVAGALLFTLNSTAMNLHTVALRKYNRRHPNYLLYWKMIERSCDRSCKQFDMGCSLEGSTLVRFKKHWGSKIIPLYYNFYFRKLKRAPVVDPTNIKYRVARSLWKRLPLFLTTMLGPHLISGLA